MTTSHPVFPFEHLQFHGIASWSTGLFQSSVPVLCQIPTATTSEEAWNTLGNGKEKQWREYLWRPFTASICAKGEPSLSVSTYCASGCALSLVAKFVQSNTLISPELLTVLEEEATRDLYSLGFFQNWCYYFYTLSHISKWKILNQCVEWEARSENK